MGSGLCKKGSMGLKISKNHHMVGLTPEIWYENLCFGVRKLTNLHLTVVRAYETIILLVSY